MSFLRLPSLILISTLLLSSCMKKDDTPEYHGMIQNGLQQRVYLDFYASQSDYENNRNPVRSLTVEGNGTVAVPEEFEGGATYFLDWYSEDLYYSNWSRNINVIFKVPNITPDLDPVMILSGNQSPARKLCLKAGKSESVWHATNAYNWSWGNSYWNLLSDEEKYRRLRLKKNFTGIYYWKDAAGNIDSTNFNYSTFTSQTTGELQIQFPSGQSGYLHTNIVSGMPAQFDSLRTEGSIPQTNSYNYIFTKQP
ncbi:MAG: hypothetical protein EOP49_28880 [Sphingobacteriales bacterium]|nr:MAG: hypothetical protein EOP49_28880 [Sphingobacteriales bacterium]